MLNLKWHNPVIKSATTLPPGVSYPFTMFIFEAAAACNVGIADTNRRRGVQLVKAVANDPAYGYRRGLVART